MSILNFDFSKTQEFVSIQEIEAMLPAVEGAHEKLHKKTGSGKDFLGWLEWPNQIDPHLVDRIEETGKRIAETSDALVIIGIGGSYLGARAAIEMLRPHFFQSLNGQKGERLEVYFAGQHLSSDYLAGLLKLLEEKEVTLNVISKSGTTTEPAVAFRILKDFMERKYGKAEAKKRIIATTDEKRGALKGLADQEGYQTFVIPDDIGGRYSVLTAVGLLPMAAAGIPIREVLKGAQDGYRAFASPNLIQNSCYQYAAVRNKLYQKGKTIELLVGYEPRLTSFGEWWKQLFGESEGKEGKGIFPATVHFTTDLHSMGQYIQQGMRNLFETVLYVGQSTEVLTIEADEDNLDGLNYLAGKTVHEVNEKAFQGTMLAHLQGGVPNLTIQVPELSPYVYGYLTYFFQKACGLSGYLLGVNPFDQPGVEDYKRNMFALLGKKGYEQERERLIKGMVSKA